MQPAAVKLARALDNLEINPPRIPVISNVNALPESRPDQIKDNLIRQITCSVLWEKSVRLMIEKGVDKFFEIGPGKVLKGLLRKIDPRVEVVNIDTQEDINRLSG